MNLQQQIDAIIAKHVIIIDAIGNELIEEIQWNITDVPFVEWEAWRMNYNKKATESLYISQKHIRERMVMLLYSSYWKVAKIQINIYSVPVKFKHEYRAIEQL